jgi:hypothetical protein
MADRKALRNTFMVPTRFHQLNKRMRQLALMSSPQPRHREEWREKAEALSELIKHLLGKEVEVTADDFRRGRIAQANLPEGRFDYRELVNLISIYREHAPGYNRIGRWANLTTGLQGRMVCSDCAEGWMKRYDDGRLQWENRTQTRGDHFILGKQSASNDSCNIFLNVLDYAGHPDGFHQGFRCNGASQPPHRNKLGFSLTIRPNHPTWSNILFFPKLDATYNLLANNVQDLQDLLRENCRTPSNKFEDWQGFADLGHLPRPNHLWRQCNTIFNFDQFSNHSVLFFEGLFVKGHDGARTVYFQPHKCDKKIQMQSKSLYAEERTLGLFVLVKGSGLVHENELNGYFTRLPSAMSEGLLERIYWPANSGFLYKFEPKFFDSYAEETGSSIDLNDRMEIPLLRAMKDNDPELVLPKIETNLKRINLYRCNRDSIVRIMPLSNQTAPHVPANEKLLIHITGFGRPDQRTIRVVVKKDDGSRIASHPLMPMPMRGNFATIDLPRGTGEIYAIEVNVFDGETKNESFILTTRWSRGNRLNPKELELSLDTTENSDIVRNFNTDRIQENLELTEAEAESIVSDPARYMELVKSELYNGPPEFRLPTAKMKHYIGFDHLSFPHQDTEYELGARLRSSGIYYPMPAMELRATTNSSWKAFEEHLVRLSDSVHLLLTPNPLSYYGLSLNNDQLAAHRLTWTNHGTFIKGKIPQELNRIPIVERPHFLGLCASSPKEHIETLINIMADISPEHKARYAQDIESNFEVTHLYERSLDEANIGRLYQRQEFEPHNERWKPIGSQDSVLVGNHGRVNGSSLKRTDSTGKIVYCDLLYASRVGDVEKKMLFRINHEDGTKEYLSIARFMRQDYGKWQQEQMEWVAELKRTENNSLAYLYRYIGGKFSGFNQTRAFDWSFIEIETLRSFAVLFGYRRDSSTNFRSHSNMWPLPLRKYLLGGGRWDRVARVNTDPMSGAYQNKTHPLPQDIENALIRAVHRWVWLDQNPQ